MKIIVKKQEKKFERIIDNKAAKEDFLKQRKMINHEKSVRTPQSKFNPIKTPK